MPPVCSTGRCRPRMGRDPTDDSTGNAAGCRWPRRLRPWCAASQDDGRRTDQASIQPSAGFTAGRAATGHVSADSRAAGRGLEARALGAEWVTLDEAATLLGVTTKWLRRALIWPQFRRSLGWPRCLDGHQMWRFPRAALDSGTSHAFGSTVPDREPLHGLPPGHRRQDEIDMGVWPPDLGMPST